VADFAEMFFRILSFINGYMILSPDKALKENQMKRYLSLTLALILLVTFATSCKSTKEFATLAQAGTSYTTAMDSLLLATQQVEIDTTSERLLQDDTLSNLSLKQYRNLSDQNEETVRLIALLRRHVKLLSRYFGLLQELATSNAPGRAKTAIGGVIDNLNSVSKEIRGSALVPANVASGAGLITSAIISGKIRGALKEELNARKDTIEKELFLQEGLLKFLSEHLTHDFAIIKETREQRLVITPLTSETPIANADGWVNNRRSILTMSLVSQELNTASNSVKTLREAFGDLVSDKLTLDRVNLLLNDFSSLLAVAEKLRS
jgi:hypothetical protein